MARIIQRTRWYLAILLVAPLLATLVSPSGASTPDPWATDDAHTEINFSITHFFTPVTGSFGDYKVNLDYNAEEPEKSTVEARIAVVSVNTGNERRDAHLRSEDWFGADEHPYMTFKSTAVRKVGENQLVASGPLTIKGESRVIELPITLLGTQPIPEPMREMLGGSKQVASFQASTTIDRSDFGVGVGSWAGTMIVGGEVDIEILLEAHNR